MKTKRLLISFSGGRTSAFMLWWLLHKWADIQDYEVQVVFANTGKEDEETLIFVDEVATAFNINIVWVEGYPSDKGKGWAVNHKIVSYETASRNGEPYEAMISRLGIPSTNAPFCSDQLKRKAIESYLRSIGWANGSYEVAIGLRSDEPKRYRRRKKHRLYPLVDLFPVNKAWVLDWWRQQDFDLLVHEDFGNCDNCWKKDMPRLYRNAVRKPKSFEWWADMEEKYGHLNPRNTELKPPFHFNRGNISVRDILNKSKTVSQEEVAKETETHKSYKCGESCEPF